MQGWHEEDYSSICLYSTGTTSTARETAHLVRPSLHSFRLAENTNKGSIFRHFLRCAVAVSTRTMTASNDGKKSSVRVSPGAFVSMIMHATQHGTTAVHGVLLGSISSPDNVVTVDQAIAICHETPTKPLIDTALALVQASTEQSIVGWYTAPERLQDQRPGPAALRIVASLAAAATDGEEPVLVVLQNEPLSQIARGYKAASPAVQAFGKDFGQQWLEPLEVNITKEADAASAAQQAYKEAIPVPDLVDHWESSNVEWLHNAALTKCVNKHC